MSIWTSERYHLDPAPSSPLSRKVAPGLSTGQSSQMMTLRLVSLSRLKLMTFLHCQCQMIPIQILSLSLIPTAVTPTRITYLAILTIKTLHDLHRPGPYPPVNNPNLSHLHHNPCLPPMIKPNYQLHHSLFHPLRVQFTPLRRPSLVSLVPFLSRDSTMTRSSLIAFSILKKKCSNFRGMSKWWSSSCKMRNENIINEMAGQANDENLMLRLEF